MTYEKMAKDFLKRNGAKMSITFKEEKFNPWNDTRYKWMHNIYRVRIDRKGKSYTFNFTDSAKNYQDGKRPTCYDVLACLTKYDVGNYHDFCDEFGYERYDYDMVDYVVVDGEYYNRKSWNTYKAVKKEYEKIYRLFNDVMDELCEIQ